MVFDVGAREGKHRKVLADAQMAQRLVAAWTEAAPAGLLDWCEVNHKPRLQPHFLGKDIDELLGSDQVGSGWFRRPRTTAARSPAF